MISRKTIVSSVVALLIAASASLAQKFPYDVEFKPHRGFIPNADLLKSPMDSVDVVNGNLHLEVPLASLRSGRGGMGFDLSLIYNSQIWDLQPERVTADGGQSYFLQRKLVSGTGGWQYNFNAMGIFAEMRQSTQPDNGFTCGGADAIEAIRLHRASIGLGDGSMHTLHLRGYGTEIGDKYYGDGFYGISLSGVRTQCAPRTQLKLYPSDIQGLLTYYTSDGSFLKWEIPASKTAAWTKQEWTLYFTDGRRVKGHGRSAEAMIDANGNRIDFVRVCQDYPVCNQLYATIRNESGQQIDIEFANWSSPRDVITTTTAAPSGPSPKWIVNWQGGAPTINWGSYQCSDRNDQYRDCPMSLNAPGINSIEIPSTPTGRMYTFGYSGNDKFGYGELNSMTTPSGAMFSYEYAQEGISKTLDTFFDNGVKHKRITNDGETLDWSYLYTNTTSTLTSPDGGITTNTFYNKKDAWSWAHGLVWRIDGPLGTSRVRTWAQNPVWGRPVWDQNNAFVQTEQVTVGGVTPITATTVMKVDKNGNPNTKLEYDWSDPTNAGALKRQTNWTYFTYAPSYWAGPADIPMSYWRPTTSETPRRLNAVMRQTVSDSSSTHAITDFAYDDPYTRGNVVAEKRWKSDSPGTPPTMLDSTNAVIFQRMYDAYGNLIATFEPDVATKLTYDSSGRFLTRVDYGTGTSAQRSWGFNWDTAAGVVTSKTDLDNNIVTSYTYDAVGRPRTAEEAGRRITETIYDDQNLTTLMKRDLRGRGLGEIQTLTRFDRLGRVIQMQTADGIKVDTTYKVLPNSGKLVVTSSPYRQYTDPTLQWTCTSSDLLDRVTSVTVMSGASTPAPTNCEPDATHTLTGMGHTSYDGNRTRVADPSDRIRDQFSDALGRLTKVIENPTGPDNLKFSTDYTYDPLDHLIKVVQPSAAATQTRLFSYDTLGLLRSAFNPENGTTSYSYYPSGDLQTRSDQRGCSSTYAYDELHRIKTTSYAGTTDCANTPAVTRSYHLSDSTSPNIGRLKSITSAAATTNYTSYDSLGRLLSQNQTIAGGPGTIDFGYEYYLDDALYRMRYPSGSLIEYTVDNAGRPTRTASATKTYADSISYDPDGRVAQFKLGNDLFETHEYRPAGVSTKLKLGSLAGGNDKLELQYDYDANGYDNGNIMRQVTRRGSQSWYQHFAYDEFNRLQAFCDASSADCDPMTGWGQRYAYDRFGNGWLTSSSLAPESHEVKANAFDPATNRLNTASYDNAGNITAASYDPRLLKYDAENRLVSATSSSNGSAYFNYDGDGRRIRKEWTGTGAAVTYYAYDQFGHVAAEYSSQPSSPGTTYPFPDLLGSIRAVSSEKPSTGTAAVTECYDYAPFGRLLSSSNNSRPNCYPSNPDYAVTSSLSEKFTGKKRDVELGLDYFGARYSLATQGRFLTTDPINGSKLHIQEPQRWNMYVYAMNNPVKNIDVDGKFSMTGHMSITYAAFHLAGIDKMSRVGISVLDSNIWADWGLQLQFGPESQHLHFLKRPSESEASGYAAGINVIRNGAQEAYGFINGTGPASERIGDVLHTIQDSYAHTRRDASGAIVGVDCFICSRLIFTGKHTHADPDATDAKGNLTPVAQEAMKATAGFLSLMNQSKGMSQNQFDLALQEYLDRYFKNRIKEEQKQ